MSIPRPSSGVIDWKPMIPCRPGCPLCASIPMEEFTFIPPARPEGGGDTITITRVPRLTAPAEAPATIQRFEDHVDEAVAAVNAGTGSLKAVLFALMDLTVAQGIVAILHDEYPRLIPTARPREPGGPDPAGGPPVT